MAIWVEIWQRDGNPPREVSVHLLAGYPNPQGLGPKNGAPGYNLPQLRVLCLGLDVAAGWGFAAGWGSAAGLNSTGLEFAAGVENAPGEAGYPC